MLDVIGDILNLTVAGVVFPLMLLPVSGLIQTSKKAYGGFLWLVLCAGLLITGILFVLMAPRLQSPGEVQIEFLLRAFIITVVVSVSIFIHGPRKISKLLAENFSSIVTLTGRAVMWLLLLMAFIQFAVVLLRYVFGVNFIFMQESITYFHGTVFLIAAGYALLTDDHVRVDIFYRSASPRQKAWVDAIGAYAFLFPICLLIIWTASPYVARSWLVMEGSTDSSGIQGVFYLKSLIPAFALLLAMAGFVTAHRSVETLTEQR